jgi:uroporphyrinogen-III synthase
VLNTAGIDWTKAVMYRTVASDLSDININEYDMLVFFSHQGIKSLFQNFPKFEQGEKKLQFLEHQQNKLPKKLD